jgi:DedD protein
MGLFSFLSKNKRDAAGQDSGYYSRDASADEALGAQARSKRASSAAAGAAEGGRGRRSGKELPDPVLPEKKRARRRLVGAIALALAVAVGLPMVLDSEPKPVASDIAIDIPSKDKPAASAADKATAAKGDAKADAGLDQSEEIVDEPAKPAVPAPKPLTSTVAPAKENTAGNTAAPKSEAARALERDNASREAAARDAAKRAAAEREATAREAATRQAARDAAAAKEAARITAAHEAREAREAREAKDAKDAKEAARRDAKPAPTGNDAARALAILEGKAADRPVKPADAGNGKFIVQVAALATQDKVDELQEKLSQAGIHSYTQRTPTAAGERIRVRVGPFGSREEAEKVRAKLSRIGLSGSLVPA